MTRQVIRPDLLAIEDDHGNIIGLVTVEPAQPSLFDVEHCDVTTSADPPTV